MNTFTTLGINESLIQALADHKITQPTAIQKQAIPLLLQENRDAIALAQTGTGKTAAFGLPLLQHVDIHERRVQAVVLSPTRELGQQTAKQLGYFAKYLPKIITRVVYGGVPIGPQAKTLRPLPHVLVATPGRLIDLVERRIVNLAHVTHLVLDEADELLNMGFQPAVDQILGFIPKERKIWLFSATMPKMIHRLVQQYMKRDHLRIMVSPSNEVNKNIAHQYIVCASDAKLHTLKSLLHQHQDQQSIVFGKTRAIVQRIAEQLAREGLRVASLHGDMTQHKRTKVMNSLKNGHLQALIATDVAARGIDVKALHAVIHYDFPDKAEHYTHRSGRTARAGQSGLSIVLITQKEVHKINRAAKLLHIRFNQIKGPNQAELKKHRLAVWTQRMLKMTPTQVDPTLIQETEACFASLSKQELITRLIATI